MGEGRSHWFAGIVYSNADDPRLLVPLPSRLGWAVNFANPRAVWFLFWVWIVWLIVSLTIPIAAHPRQFAQDPTPLVWVLLSSLLAFVVFVPNGVIRVWEYRWIRSAAYGLVAMGIGFAIQALINGPLAAWWKQPLRAQVLVMAFIAGASQTAGSAAGLLLLGKTLPPANLREALRSGLILGLGFAVSEIMAIYVSWARRYTPAHLEWSVLLGVWERGSAAMFHIYSAGLIAAAMFWRRYWPFWFFVIVMHTLTDFLAGAGLFLSVYVLEAAISLLAATMWITFLLFAARARLQNGTAPTA